MTTAAERKHYGYDEADLLMDTRLLLNIDVLG
jgi:hypothetical protein